MVPVAIKDTDFIAERVKAMLVNHKVYDTSIMNRIYCIRDAPVTEWPPHTLHCRAILPNKLKMYSTHVMVSDFDIPYTCYSFIIYLLRIHELSHFNKQSFITNFNFNNYIIIANGTLKDCFVKVEIFVFAVQKTIMK